MESYEEGLDLWTICRRSVDDLLMKLAVDDWLRTVYVGLIGALVHTYISNTVKQSHFVAIAVDTTYDQYYFDKGPRRIMDDTW